VIKIQKPCVALTECTSRIRSQTAEIQHAPSPITPVIEIKPQPAQPKEVKPSQEKTLPSFLAKLRRVKHIEIYAAIAVIAVMVLIYLSTFGGSSKPNSSDALTKVENDFVREMEQKLVKTLSQVKGAGKVDAMVTAVGSGTLEIAYNIDEKTITQSGGTGAANSTTTVVKTPVIINGKNGPQPLVLLEIKPKLKGVVIVATGANDPGVRLSLLRAVQALVADPGVNIEILTRKQ